MLFQSFKEYTIALISCIYFSVAVCNHPRCVGKGSMNDNRKYPSLVSENDRVRRSAWIHEGCAHPMNLLVGFFIIVEYEFLL